MSWLTRAQVVEQIKRSRRQVRMYENARICFPSSWTLQGQQMLENLRAELAYFERELPGATIQNTIPN